MSQFFKISPSFLLLFIRNHSSDAQPLAISHGDDEAESKVSSGETAPGSHERNQIRFRVRVTLTLP